MSREEKKEYDRTIKIGTSILICCLLFAGAVVVLVFLLTN